MSEIEQPQRQRRNRLHLTPLVLQQRACAAGYEGTGRHCRLQAELVADVNARAADANAVVQQTVAKNNL